MNPRGQTSIEQFWSSTAYEFGGRISPLGGSIQRAG